MTEEQAIAALRSRPPAAQKALLARMDAATKNRVLVKLQMQTRPTKPVDAQTKYDFEGNSVLSNAGTGTKVRHAIDHALDLLPTIAGTAGSLAGGSKKLPSGVALASITGGGGEAARELLGNVIYSDPKRLDALPDARQGYGEFLKETAKDIGGEMALQGGSEAFGRGIGGALNKLMEMTGLTKAAASQALAEAGQGVQVTPGEARGDGRGGSFVRKVEKYLPHVPGAMGPMERFGEKRAGQVAAQEAANATSAQTRLAKELDAVGKSGMSREQSGAAVYNAVKAESDRQAASVYDPVKKMLGLPSNAKKDALDAAAEQAAKSRTSTIVGPDGKPTVTPGDGGRALAALREADKAFATASQRTALELVEKIPKPEAAHSYIANASLRDLRQILPTLSPEVRAGLSRNILEDALNTGREPLTGRYNVKAVLKQLDKLDRDGPKTKLLFGPQGQTVRESLREIERIEKATALTKRRVGADVPMGEYKGAHAAMSLLTLPVSELIGFTAAGRSGLGASVALGTAGLGMVGSRMLAEAITNPKTAVTTLVWLRRLAQYGGGRSVPAAVDLFDPHRAPDVPMPMPVQ